VPEYRCLKVLRPYLVTAHLQMANHCLEDVLPGSRGPEGPDHRPSHRSPILSQAKIGRPVPGGTRIGPFPTGMILKSCWIHPGFPTAFPTRAIFTIVFRII